MLTKLNTACYLYKYKHQIYNLALLLYVLELRYTCIFIVWHISFVFGCFIMKYSLVFDEENKLWQVNPHAHFQIFFPRKGGGPDPTPPRPLLLLHSLILLQRYFSELSLYSVNLIISLLFIRIQVYSVRVKSS